MFARKDFGKLSLPNNRKKSLHGKEMFDNHFFPV